MPAGFSSASGDDLVQAEQDVRARIGDRPIDFDSLAAVSNIFRVANTARSHFERTVLRDVDLSFSGFTVLWVLWVWGEREARHLAAEAGVSKGTLTGVVTTLSNRGLVQRRSHAVDRRLVLVSATEAGLSTMDELFLRFNAEEAKITAALSVEDKQALARSLRELLRTLEDL